MSNEIKKRKNKKQQNQAKDDDFKKLTKDEESIAKYLKFNCPTRKANLMGMKVDYFIGSKAIDCLMSSKWATGAKNTEILFHTRDSCKLFLQTLLEKELYHRALKVYKDQQVDQVVSKGETTTPENTPQVRKRKNNNTNDEDKDKDKKDDKSKRKFKLEMHDDQKFLDLNEPYVWIYDPPTTKSIIVGLLLVFGAIGVCLFPLWPPIVREGVYYLSLAGAGFLGFILSLAVFKYILFAAIWIVTFGSIHFWLLPNLTEDVGVLESFVPLYKIKKPSSSSSTTTKSNTTTTTTTSKNLDDGDEKKKEAAEEFNKLPLDEQLMKKFDENIDDEGGDDEDNNKKNDNDDNVDEDYDVIEKDVDLKNN